MGNRVFHHLGRYGSVWAAHGDPEIIPWPGVWRRDPRAESIVIADPSAYRNDGRHPKSKELVRPDRPERRLPQIFGRGSRDRAMIALAINGPMHVLALGRAIGSDSHKTWSMVEVLRLGP